MQKENLRELRALRGKDVRLFDLPPMKGAPNDCDYLPGDRAGHRLS